MSLFFFFIPPLPLGNFIKEYENSNALLNDSYRIINITGFFYGCGHAVQNNHLYYQKGGTNVILK